MAMMVLVDGKFFKNNNSDEFCAADSWMRQQKLTRIVVIKFLPSTYTITATSWLLPLISLFTLAILNRSLTF